MKANGKQLKLVALFLFSMLIFTSLQAQKDDKYGDLKRPDDISDASFDNFKNSSFDIYFNVGKLDQNLANVESNLIKYKQDPSAIDFNSLKADIKSLNEIGEAMPKLQSELTALKDKSETMVKDAKNITPKTKSPKAVSNTNKSVNALDKANDKLKELVDHQKTALETAKQLLGNN
ncbi:MAG: hypothetical protein U0W24_23185 [Bacteroidales bacterium]